MNGATVKGITEVTLGGYSLSIDEEKMGLLYSLCNDHDNELRQIQELTDFLLDMACGAGTPDDEECLRYMKYLKNLRGVLDYLHSIDVRHADGGK